MENIEGRFKKVVKRTVKTRFVRILVFTILVIMAAKKSNNEQIKAIISYPPMFISYLFAELIWEAESVGLCIIPGHAISHDAGCYRIFEQNDLDFEQFRQMIDWDNQTARPFAVSEEPKIPFITHRIWLTHPDKPREITSVLAPEIVSECLRTYEVLDKTEVAWVHTMWVFNKEDTPKTVALFESNGVTVRELRELKLYKKYGRFI